MAPGATILTIDPHDLSSISGCLPWLRAGGIVGVPTESSYGLVVQAHDAQAVARLRALKGRDSHKPLPLVALDAATVQGATTWLSPMAELMAALWPGPLTLALTPKQAWPEGIVSPEGTVGVRVSAHPVLQALCAATGAWLTATSANVAGAPPACCLADVPPALLREVLWLDGGTAPGGLPSTVVVPGPRHTLRIARAGAVTQAQLQAVVGAHVFD